MFLAPAAAILLASSGGSAAAAALPPPPVAKLRLGPSEMFHLADIAQQKGDVATALTVYTALESNPDADVRTEARFRRAKLESAKGSLTKAAVLLRQIIDERPSAVPVRVALAQVLDRMGDKDGAWRQLRAVQSSGLPPEVARLIDRYSAALRAQRPYGASLEVAIAPDSNINRATRSDTLGTVFGDFQIADEGKAKSGTGLSLNGQVFRRVHMDDDASLLFRGSGFANLYRSDRFNDIAADLAVGPEISLGRDRLQLEVGATHRWFGQKPYLRSARVAGTFSHPLRSRTLLRFTGSAALIDNRLNDLQDGKSYF